MSRKSTTSARIRKKRRKDFLPEREEFGEAQVKLIFYPFRYFFCFLSAIL